MKHEKFWIFFTAAVLAFFTAWGTVGCLVTAFDLTLEYPVSPLLACGLAALVCAALFSVRYGASALLCLLALAAGYLYRDGTAWVQLLQLIHKLATVYDRAYGWGVPLIPEHLWGEAFADWPLGIIGGVIAMAVTQTVVRRKTTWLPVLATLLPLGSCIVVTDTVPGEPWLLAVMTCLTLLVLTADLRRENAAQGVRLLLTAALPVTLALWGLFLLNPQKDYVNQSSIFRENILIATQNIPKLMETGMNQIASGLRRQPEQQIDLAELGARIPFTYPVMEVAAEHSGTLYLRQQDYDRYDGLGWSISTGRTEDFSAATGLEETIVIRTENQKNSLFLPYHPSSDTTLVDGSAKNSEDALVYSIRRNRLPEDWRQTAYQNTTVSPEEWSEYLSLPDTTRQRALDHLNQCYPEDASNTAKAELIAALVLDSARYDLDPGRMPSSETDFALWFLEKSDRGYCVHFATAATVLLRAAGVPARYVTGYMLEASAGETVTVTEENAHAWAEYYEPNLGLWLPLEATPAEEAPIQIIGPQITPTEAPATTVPSTEPVAEHVTEESENTSQPSEATVPETLQSIPDASSPSAVQHFFPTAVLLLPLALLALPLQRSVRLTLRRRRQHRGDANQQALQRWQESEYLARLLKECPTEELMVLAQKAKFSQYQLTEEELSQFDSFNRACLRRLRKKPWYLRLVYQYIYAVY